MAQGAISEEITRHVEAVLALSKREVLGRLLREAERCIEFEQTSAAAILAGVALEELSSWSDLNIVQQRGRSLKAWRELRNRAAHPSASEPPIDPKVVAAMVAGIGAILKQIEEAEGQPQSKPPSDNELTSIRGKYAFVPTSVRDFLKRKREDVEFEIGE